MKPSLKPWLTSLFVAGMLGLWVLPASASDADFFIAKGKQYNPKYRDALTALQRESSTPLTDAQLARLKDLLRQNGWPTAYTAGNEAIDAMGVLLLRASNDRALQDKILELIDPQVSVDVSPAGYARLVDEIQFQEDGTQHYGTRLGIVNGKVAAVPALNKLSGMRFFRDFYGLPSHEEQILEVQKKIDAGMGIAAANPFPVLSQEFKPYTEPDIRMALGRMIESDQDLRNELIGAKGEQHTELMRRLPEVDEKNLSEIKSIFSKVGFPTVEMVGRDGVSTAFLLVQHADDDPKFQRQALDLAKPLMERREMSRQQYALLVDRVLLAEGKNQLYGSQTELVNGRVVPRPVSDPDRLDERRRLMAMGTEAAYLEILQKRYVPEEPDDKR